MLLTELIRTDCIGIFGTVSDLRVGVNILETRATSGFHILRSVLVNARATSTEGVKRRLFA
jgi:hypothetical protein